MNFKVFLHPKAVRFLRKADPSLRKRIEDRLIELEDSLKERGEPLWYSSFWRLRVGDYRVIYEVDEEKSRVIILFIGHRKEVYDDFSRLF